MNAPPVQYVTTGDGYNIAYAVSGSGPPLIFLPPNLHDIQLVWSLHRDWIEGLGARFRVVQYDSRGEGLSTRGLGPETTANDFLRDLDAIVEHLALERFFLWAWAARSHDAVRYASLHPERIEGLILHTCSAVNAVRQPVFYTMLPKEDWLMFLNTLFPTDLPQAEHQERVLAYQRCVTTEDWDRWVQALWQSDIADELKKLSAPALVLHNRRFPRLAIEESMAVAALIPGAHFQVVDGAEIFGDAGQGLSAVDSFLEALPASTNDPRFSGTVPGLLSAREVEVLRLLAGGKSNAQIADDLVISLNTVNRHVSNIYGKIGAANRAEAASYATRNGIA